MKKTRLAFNFSEEELTILNRIVKATGTNRTKVVRMALKLCNDALDNTFSTVMVINLGFSGNVEIGIGKHETRYNEDKIDGFELAKERSFYRGRRRRR